MIIGDELSPDIVSVLSGNAIHKENAVMQLLEIGFKMCKEYFRQSLFLDDI